MRSRESTVKRCFELREFHQTIATAFAADAALFVAAEGSRYIARTSVDVDIAGLDVFGHGQSELTFAENGGI